MTPIPHDDHNADPPAGRETGNGIVGTVLIWMVPILIAALVVALVVIKKKRTAVPLSPPPRELAAVAVSRIRHTTYQQTLTLPARLDANRTADLSFELNGRLEKWLVKEGEAVTQGQTLAELNTDELQATMAQLRTRRQTSQRTVGVSEQNLAVSKVALTQAKRDAEALNLELQAAEASLKLAGKEYNRIKTLIGSNIAAQADFDTASNGLTQAELDVAKTRDRIERAKITIQVAATQVAQAEANLELDRSRCQEIDREIASLEVTISKTDLIAPFAGHLDEYFVEQGEVVAPGQTVARLYDLARLRALADVPDRYVPLMDTGNPMINKYLEQAMPGAIQKLSASVTVPGLPKLTGGAYAGVELEAAVDRVAEASDPASNTFRVELLVENPGLALKQGIIVEARVSFLVYEDAIVIPVKAVQVTDRGPRVFIVTDTGGKSIAKVKNIEPISIQNDRILIRGPVTEGDRLIVSGWKGLVDGEEVAVVLEDGILNGKGKYTPSATDEPAPIHVPKTSEAPESHAGEGDK